MTVAGWWLPQSNHRQFRQAQEIRTYWEERNRERFAYVATLPPKPGMEALYAKLQVRKAELGMT